MNTLDIALAVEARKAVASRVIPWTSGILILGLAALTGGLLAAAGAGDERILARLGPLAETLGWTLLVGTAAQILAAGGFGACGILSAWLYGREFADGTVSGLFALPVPLFVAQVSAVLGVGVWVPLIAPALWAIAPDTVPWGPFSASPRSPSSSAVRPH